MKHFPDKAWLDLARRVLSPEEISRMQAHLDSGCAKCRRSYRLWMAVTEAAHRESDYVPDESIVAAAKNAFATASWASAPVAQPTFLALMFDSFLQPAILAGVRASSTTARHLLYQSGPLVVDLRVEAQGEAMSIAGQILESEADATAACGWNVTLISGSAAMARASTNEFGEFYFEAVSGPELRVRVQKQGQKDFTLTLPQ